VSRTSRRAAMGLALVLSVSPLLGACASGQDAVTRMAYAPSDGIEAQVGSIKVLNALVVAAPTGSVGTVSMSVVNTGSEPDRLVEVTATDGRVATSGASEVPADGVLAFGSPSGPSATIEGLGVTAGDTIGLRLRFEKAGEVSVQTVVYPAAGDYATITPSAG
jgi:copper(I)-binding protein